MKMKIFIVYGIVVCILFLAAGTRGYVISSMTQSAKWGPQGHSMYHK